MPKVGRPTILLVDGDEPLRHEMVQTLAAEGYAIIETANGNDALSEFRLHEAEIVLAIIEMVIPGMSGLDVAAELDRLEPGIRILYMSDLHESIAMESIARRSPERVLLKPFTSQDLSKRVKALLLAPYRRTG